MFCLLMQCTWLVFKLKNELQNIYINLFLTFWQYDSHHGTVLLFLF